MHLGYSHEETPFGPIFLRTKIFNVDHEHGNVRLEQFREISRDSLSLIGRDDYLSNVDPSRMVYFDTETTGLSSGTGSYIFLAGVGYFEDSRFVVKQYFLRDYDEESAFLYAVNEALKPFACIVTYNGKSYDWPLLQTRLTCNRLRAPAGLVHHIDLLHHARRIWKRRLDSCSLDTIERDVLNYFRYDDTPGYLIPGIYFNYLRDYQFEPIEGIIEHNLNDIISLAALLIKSDQIIKNPLSSLDHFLDLYSLAHYYDQIQRYEESAVLYQTLMDMRSDTRLMNDVKMKLGYCYKRLNDWDRAIQLWEESIEIGCFRVDAYIELAKYHEHRSGELGRAIMVVQRALASIEVIEQLRTNDDYTNYRAELTSRLNRLTEKISKLDHPAEP